jgi:dihydrolipoamide dehydrogenase
VPRPEVDLVVIGGGPGGYVGAIRAAQLGMRVTLVEREALGGVCLNFGCIPAKSLLRSAHVLDLARRAGDFGVEVTGVRGDLGAAVGRSHDVVRHVVQGVEFLLEHHVVEVIRDSARLISAHEVRIEGTGDRVRARHVMLATGARPHSPWPVDGHRVLTSREALELPEPGRIVVIGAGCVGVELAEVYAAFGGHVTLVERHASILADMDPRTTAVLRTALERRGVEIRTSTSVRTVEPSGTGVTVTLERDGATEQLTADRALVALGITPNSANLGLEALGVPLDERGFVVTDALGATTVEGVWAVGDLTGRLPLAHVASAQATVAVEAMAGLTPRPLDYDWIPRAVYTHPQVASIGLSEAAATAAGHEVAVGRFPFGASGSAIALGETEGLVTIVADRDTREVLGCQVVGETATELIHEIALAHTLETTVDEILGTVHAHPTLSEVVREAALDVTGTAIHFARPSKG